MASHRGKRRPKAAARAAAPPKKRVVEDDEEIESGSEASLEDAVAANSDSEGDDGGSAAHHSSGDEDAETVEVQRLALMKKYIKAAGLEDKEEKDVVEFLQKEAARVQKKVLYRTGYYLSSRDNECGTLAGVATSFYRGHKESPTCLALSPTNRNHAFTGGKDKTLILWDLETGVKLAMGRAGKEAKATAGGHLRAILSVAVTAEGRTVATGGCDHLIKLWDPRDLSQGCTNTLLDHVEAVTGIAADPLDHTRIYSIGGARDMELRVWNLASPESRPLKFFGHTEKACCLDILTHGRPLSGGEDSTLRLWRVERDTHLLYDWHKRPVDACAAINATRYVSGAQDNHLALWSVASRKPLATFENAHGSHNGSSSCGITALGKLPFSDFFVSGSNDGFIRAWVALDELPPDGNRRKMRHSIAPLFKVPVGPGFVNALQITPDGAMCVAACAKEPRLGKWESARTASNGLLVVPLRLPLDCATSAAGDNAAAAIRPE